MGAALAAFTDVPDILILSNGIEEALVGPCHHFLFWQKYTFRRRNILVLSNGIEEAFVVVFFFSFWVGNVPSN